MSLPINYNKIPKDADPVQVVLQFAKRIEEARNKNDQLPINDRDEWFVKLVLGLITDTRHMVGRFVGRAAFKEWSRRGGKAPRFWKFPSVINNEKLLHALHWLREDGE